MGTRTNFVTPENLTSITFQYVQPATGVRSGIASIFLTYGENNQQQTISIQEVKNYIGYLQIRATLEGKQVMATQYTNNKTVISVGIEGAGFTQVVQIETTGNNPCTAVPRIIYLNHAAPFIVGDIIYTDVNLAVPLVGFNLIANVTTGIIYGLDPLTGEVLAATGETCVIPPPVGLPGAVTFRLNGVDFSNAAGNNLAVISPNVTSITGEKTANYTNSPLVVQFYLPVRGFGSFEDDYDTASLPDSYWNVTRPAPMAGNGMWNVLLTYWNPLGGNTTLDILDCPAANQSTVKLTIGTGAGTTGFDYITAIPFTGVAGADPLQVGGTYKDLQLAEILAYCGKVQGVAGNVYHVIAKSPFATPGSTCVVTFRKNGNFVSTLAGFPCENGGQDNFDINDADLPAYADYDEINFTYLEGGAAAPEVWNVNYTLVEGGVCALGGATVYSANGTLFAPGTQLYLNPDLSGTNIKNFIVETPSAGNPIYNVFNGLIGVATGNMC